MTHLPAALFPLTRLPAARLALPLVLLLALGLALGGCHRKKRGAANYSGQTYEWKMATTWAPNSPILGDAATRMAANIDKMSGGRLQVRVYGAGEYVPAMGVFEAVREGTVEMGHGAAYYWAGTSKAAQFFSSVPYGLTAQQMNSWMYSGGGLELWRELYAGFNLVPFPAGSTGVQMGGWFRKEIKTVADLRGLKMRMPGLGGQVLTRLGGTVVLYPGPEVFPNLERGVIDAAEWLGPYHDLRQGFQDAAKYYYYPGWHEPGTMLELIVNKQKYEALPEDLQAIVASAAAEANLWMLSELEARNAEALAEMRAKGVKVLPFPDPLLKKFKEVSKQVVAGVVQEDPKALKIYQSFTRFQASQEDWQKISEQAYQHAAGL